VGWKKPVANWAKRTKPQAGARERTVPWRTSGKMYSRLLGQCGVIAPERGIISYSLSPIVPPIFFITQETTIFPPPRVLHCPPTTPCRPQGALIAIWDISAATISHGKGCGNSPNTSRSGTKSQASYRQDMGLLFSFGVTLLLVYFPLLSLFLGFHNTFVLLRKIGITIILLTLCECSPERLPFLIECLRLFYCSLGLAFKRACILVY